MPVLLLLAVPALVVAVLLLLALLNHLQQRPHLDQQDLRQLREQRDPRVLDGAGGAGGAGSGPALGEHLVPLNHDFVDAVVVVVYTVLQQFGQRHQAHLEPGVDIVTEILKNFTFHHF